MASFFWLFSSHACKKRARVFFCSPSGSYADQIMGVISHYRGISSREDLEGRKSGIDLCKKGNVVNHGRKDFIWKASSQERGLKFREKKDRRSSSCPAKGVFGELDGKIGLIRTFGVFHVMCFCYFTNSSRYSSRELYCFFKAIRVRFVFLLNVTRPRWAFKVGALKQTHLDYLRMFTLLLRDESHLFEDPKWSSLPVQCCKANYKNESEC